MASLTGNDEHKRDLSFQREYGIDQGESTSSLMLIALYDMLLEWINSANRFLHTSEKESTYSEEDILKAKMAAYANDLCNITGGPNRAFSSRPSVLSLNWFFIPRRSNRQLWDPLAPII
jgi:hypothetical protein